MRGAVDFGVAAESRPLALPAAYILPLSESVGPNALEFAGYDLLGFKDGVLWWQLLRPGHRPAVPVPPGGRARADAAPVATANYIEARNVSLTAYDAETVDRNIEMPVMGSNGKPVLPAWAKLSFEVAYVSNAALSASTRTGWIVEEAVRATSTTAIAINGIAPPPFSALDLGPATKSAKSTCPARSAKSVS